MATFTGLEKAIMADKVISLIPPCKPTSMYPNTMVLKTTFVYL